MAAARTLRTPLFLLSGAVAFALAGWWQYEAAVPSFPVVDDPGTVSMVIYGPARDVVITLTVTDRSHLRVDALVTFDLKEPARPAIPPSLCVPAVVDYVADRPTHASTEICLKPPSGGWTTSRGLLSVLLEVPDPLVVRSGPSTVVRMPGLSPTWFGTDREYDVVYEGAFDRTDQTAENQLKPEAFSPDYRGPGLRWERQLTANTPGVLPGPYGTFTDVPAERAASRSLFWAGLLGGAALSVLAWAGDLLLVGAAERRRERERRAETEARLQEIADLTAARVLAVLDERLPAITHMPPDGRDTGGVRPRSTSQLMRWRVWLRRLARWPR